MGGRRIIPRGPAGGFLAQRVPLSARRERLPKALEDLGQSEADPGHGRADGRGGNTAQPRHGSQQTAVGWDASDALWAYAQSANPWQRRDELRRAKAS